MNPGMSPAVQAAISRRASGAPVPQLSQVSSQAPMASGTPPQPMPPSALDKTSKIPTQPKTTAQKYVPQTQTDMVLSALVDQLKSNNSLEKEKLKTINGQSIQAPPPATPSFNQAPPQNAGQGIFGAPSMSTSSMQGGNSLGAGPF